MKIFIAIAAIAIPVEIGKQKFKTMINEINGAEKEINDIKTIIDNIADEALKEDIYKAFIENLTK